MHTAKGDGHGSVAVVPGAVFERLTVLELIPDRKNPRARCRCVCGNIVEPQRGALRNGRAKSCGCWRAEKLAVAGLRHGLANTPEYKAFAAAKARCVNPADDAFCNYGARGIRVTYSSFEEFFADVGPRPDGAWLDREDNDGDYAPGNCRWVSTTVSAENKRVGRIWTINGVDYDSAKAAGRALGLDASTVHRACKSGRRNGWSTRPRY